MRRGRCPATIIAPTESRSRRVWDHAKMRSGEPSRSSLSAIIEPTAIPNRKLTSMTENACVVPCKTGAGRASREPPPIAMRSRLGQLTRSQDAGCLGLCSSRYSLLEWSRGVIRRSLRLSVVVCGLL